MATNTSFLRGVLILGAAGLLAGLGTAGAKARERTERRAARDAAIELWESPSRGNTVILRRATRLLGGSLKNTEGATLGTIQDLVLTSNLDGVSYAVVSRGGVLGLGHQLHAIPWSAMRAGVGDTIVAPVSEQELDQDHGFRPSLWPSEGNPRWLSRAGERTEQVTYGVQPAVEQQEIRRRRASRILGMTARDFDNKHVGTVRDFVIAMNRGDIPFTILSYGGLLGLGIQYTAVPANAIELEPDRHVARVRVDRQILHANAFNPSQFPDLSDPIYARRLYVAYNVDPRDPDWTVLGYVPPAASAQSRPVVPVPSRPAIPAAPQPSVPVQPQPAPPAQTPITQGAQVPQTTGSEPIQDQYLAAFSPEKIQTFEGVVTGVSSFQLVGTDAEWVQLQVRTDSGGLVTVHLGPRDYVARQDFYVASNDRISVTGVQATAWRQPIILPVTAAVAGRTITLRDRTGRPLWEQATDTQQTGTQTTP